VPTLLELQAGFARYLRGGGAELIAAHVAGDALEPAQRLQIYRNHVVISLREALKATYPTVAALVGEDFFAAMVGPFIDATPPSSPCLFEYGEGLPDYIAGFAPAASVPYLADAARRDWALNAAYHSALLPAIDITALAEIDPERYGALRLALQPSLRLLQSPYPLDRIWAISQPDAEARARVDLAGGGARLQIRRDGERAVFTPLEAPAWRWRQALVEGASLGDSVMALAADPQFDLNAELPALFAEGLVCALTLPG